MRYLIKTLFLILCTHYGMAQINSPDTVCVNEIISFTTPVQGYVYSWNFDSVNLNFSTPTASAVFSGTPLSTPGFIAINHDNGNWYAFTGNYNSSEVVRLDFGNSPYNAPVATSLGTFGRPAGQRLQGVEVLQDSTTGNWYGFTVNYTPELMRLDFGNSLANIPTATVMPYTFSELAWPHQLGIRKIGNEWIGFTANRAGGITRFDFGTQITNTPAAIMLPVNNYSSPCNFSLHQQGANWHMLVTNLTGTFTGYSRFDFGTNLKNNMPAVTYLGNPGSLMSLPRGVNVFSGCGALYAYVMNEGGRLIKIDFQNDITNPAPVATSMGNIVSRANSFQPYIYNNDLNALVVGSNSVENINLLTLPAGTINAYNTPTINHSFSTPGIYDITLMVDQGAIMGAYSFCKQVVVVSGRDNLLGPDTVLCDGTSYILNAAQAGATGYQWSNGETTPSIIVTPPGGTYSVAVSGMVCGAADTVTVSFITTPVVDLGNDIDICEGELHTLFTPGSSSQYRYLWSTGATTSSITVSASGSYSLQVTDRGCTGNDTIDVTVHPLPVVNLGVDTNFCASALPYTLRSVQPPGSHYLWSNGLSTTEMNVTRSGIYWLEVSRYGCTIRDSIAIVAVPDPEVYIGADSIICTQLPARIGTEIAGAVYSWNTGATTPYIHVAETGDYVLSVNLNGCVVLDTISITAMPDPDINLGADGDICYEQTIILDAGYGSNSSYAWNTGATTSSISVTDAGTYIVDVTTEYNCTGRDTIVLSYFPDPVVSLGPDTTVCEETPLHLSAWSLNTDSLRWSDGSVGKYLQVQYGGTYIVTAINKCGTYQDTIEVKQIFCDIWLPNAFTPNGDGVNDVFRILGNIGRLEGVTLGIYNRWGERIFTTNDKLKGWDGNHKGLPASLGTYVFLLQYNIDGMPYTQHGDFHLLR